MTIPVNGDKVALTYTGTFAVGTTHDGIDMSGKTFDSTLNHGSQPKRVNAGRRTCQPAQPAAHYI